MQPMCLNLFLIDSFIASSESTAPTVMNHAHCMTTHSQNEIFKPKPLPNSIIRHLPWALTASLHPEDIEPTYYIVAAKDVKWQKAMNE